MQRRRAAALAVAVVVGVWLAAQAASPALAHDEGESDQASMLVLQAIGLIVNKHPADMDAIVEKIDDALEADDQEGVDLAKVQAAKDALEREDMDQARALLQQSIEGAAAMEPATGEETGTPVVQDPLVTRGQLVRSDVVVLALSVLVTLLGVWLARRYRPAQSVRDLRRQLAAPPSPPNPTTGP